MSKAFHERNRLIIATAFRREIFKTGDSPLTIFFFIMTDISTFKHFRLTLNGINETLNLKKKIKIK